MKHQKLLGRERQKDLQGSDEPEMVLGDMTPCGGCPGNLQVTCSDSLVSLERRLATGSIHENELFLYVSTAYLENEI